MQLFKRLRDRRSSAGMHRPLRVSEAKSASAARSGGDLQGLTMSLTVDATSGRPHRNLELRAHAVSPSLAVREQLFVILGQGGIFV